MVQDLQWVVTVKSSIYPPKSYGLLMCDLVIVRKNVYFAGDIIRCRLGIGPYR